MLLQFQRGRKFMKNTWPGERKFRGNRVQHEATRKKTKKKNEERNSVLKITSFANAGGDILENYCKKFYSLKKIEFEIIRHTCIYVLNVMFNIENYKKKKNLLLRTPFNSLPRPHDPPQIHPLEYHLQKEFGFIVSENFSRQLKRLGKRFIQ